MKYRGFELVKQYSRYEIWNLDDDGTPKSQITDYDNEFDGWLVWDTENDWQHEDFSTQPVFDSLDDVKQAIDEHLSRREK